MSLERRIERTVWKSDSLAARTAAANTKLGMRSPYSFSSHINTILSDLNSAQPINFSNPKVRKRKNDVEPFSVPSSRPHLLLEHRGSEISVSFPTDIPQLLRCRARERRPPPRDRASSISRTAPPQQPRSLITIQQHPVHLHLFELHRLSLSLSLP
jgi:hypothetical protein